MKRHASTAGSVWGIILVLLLTSLPVWAAASSATPASADFLQKMEELFAEGAASAATDKEEGTLRQMLVPGGSGSSAASADIWADKKSYMKGENVRLSYRVSKAAYIYILNIDTYDDVRLLYPNYWESDSYVKAGGTYDLPKGRYTFTVDGSPGSEHLLLVASQHPIAFLDRLSNRAGSQFPLVGATAATLRQFQDWVRASNGWATFAWSTFEVQSERDSWYIPSLQALTARIQASATEVEVGSTITFSGRGSSTPTGNIRNYRWDFENDGRIDATGETVRWTFPRAGTYNVRLIVEDNRGRTAATTVQITVKDTRVLVELNTSPNNRQVYIDGVYVGRTQLRHYLTPGPHEIRVVSPGVQDFTSTIMIPAGLRSFSLTLSF